MNICKLKHRSNPEMKRWLFFIILLSISQSTIQINYAQIKDRDIKKINQHKNNAVLLEKQNKYDEAIKEWQAITDFEGVDDSIVKEAFINMAKIYSKKGGTSFGFAVNALKTVLQIDPSDFKAHYDLGVIYFDKKLYKDAIEHFTTVIKLDPDPTKAHFMLGQIYFQKKQYDLSLKECNQAKDKLDNDVNNGSLYYKLGYIYYIKNLYDKAIIALNKSIKYDNLNADAHLLLSEIYLKQKKYEKASQENNAAKAIIPNEKRIKENIEQIQRGLNVQTQINVYLEQGNNLFGEGKWLEALDEFNEALKLDSTHVKSKKMVTATKSQIYQSHFKNGISYSNRKQWKKAIDEFNQAKKFAVTNDQMVELDSAYAAAKAERIFIRRVNDLQENGFKAVDQKEWEQAQKIFESVLFLDPYRKKTQAMLENVTVKFCYQLGVQAMDSSRWALAKYFFHQVPATDNNFPDAMTKIEQAKLAQQLEDLNSRYKAAVEKKQWKMAKEYLQEILKIKPEDAEAQKALKSVNFQIKKGFYLISGLIGLIVGILVVLVVTYVKRWIKARKKIVSILGQRKINPYVVGSPIIDENQFTGREDLIKRILSSIHNNSFLIKAGRRSGKTSLLRYLAKKLSELNGKFEEFYFIPVYIDLQVVPEHDLFRSLAVGVFEKPDFHFVKNVKLDFWENNSNYGAQRLRSDLNIFIDELSPQQQGEIRIVFLLDELDVMNEYPDPVKNSFRNIFMEAKSECLKIIATAVHIKEWTGAGSPWENFLIKEKLSLLSIQDAKNLIEKPVKGFINYTNESLNKIYKYSNGNPYFIQKFCGLLIDRAFKNDKVTIEKQDVEKIYPAFKREILNEGLDID